MSLNDIVAALNLPCSKEALRRYLKSKKFTPLIFEIKERIILTERHKELRRQFCQSMFEKSDEQLNHILFSDEFIVAITRLVEKSLFLQERIDQTSICPKKDFLGVNFFCSNRTVF